jgi:hypothetical protein
LWEITICTRSFCDSSSKNTQFVIFLLVVLSNDCLVLDLQLVNCSSCCQRWLVPLELFPERNFWKAQHMALRLLSAGIYVHQKLECQCSSKYYNISYGTNKLTRSLLLKMSPNITSGLPFL